MQKLLFLVLIAIAAAACVGEIPPTEESEAPIAFDDSSPPMVISSDTTLNSAEMLTGLTLRAGVTVDVTNPQLVVHGPLTIEAGAVLRGLAPELVLVVRGDLALDGDVESMGDLILVSDESDIPTAEELAEETTESGLEIVDPVEVPSNPIYDWTITGLLRVGHGLMATALPPPDEGRDGRRAKALFARVRGNLTIAPPPGAASHTFSFPNGEPGENMMGCHVTGGDGGRGARVNLSVRGGTLRLRDVTFAGANGAPGGNANGANCADGSVNSGGDGGRAGTFRMLVRGGAFIVLGTVTFDGWNSGPGGNAQISGQDGNPGASVTAIGGDGADVSGYRLEVTTGILYGVDSGFLFRLGNSGDGGDASAVGGNGIHGICDQSSGFGSSGANGGDATATAGEAGDVTVTVSVAPGATADMDDSFQAGDGGDADAQGGRGGNGADCWCKGGRGGNGGVGAATQGSGGTSNQPGRDGMDGMEAANGGQGGRGGNAELYGGDGGDGGDANADQAGGGNGGPGGMGEYGGVGGDGGCPGGQGGDGGRGIVTSGAPGMSC